jgi:hypothetical protein
MTNDKSMTNDEKHGGTAGLIRHMWFVIPSEFDIRASSFFRDSSTSLGMTRIVM